MHHNSVVQLIKICLYAFQLYDKHNQNFALENGDKNLYRQEKVFTNVHDFVCDSWENYETISAKRNWDKDEIAHDCNEKQMFENVLVVTDTNK